MEIEIVQRMRKEEADLARKLKAVRDLLTAYGEQLSDAAVKVPAVERAATASRGKVGIEGFGDYGRKIIAFAMQAMLTTNHPLKTRKVVEFLDAMNVNITGENKVNAVGALLSRSSDIVSHGKAGWTLGDPDTAMKIVGEYAHNETGAPAITLAAPAATGWGVPPPSPVSSDPFGIRAG